MRDHERSVQSKPSDRATADSTRVSARSRAVVLWVAMLLLASIVGGWLLFDHDEQPRDAVPADGSPNEPSSLPEPAPGVVVAEVAEPQREAIDASEPSPRPGDPPLPNPQATLTVRIMDSATRQPRKDITMRCSADAFTANPKSDSNGTFVVEGIPVPARLLCLLRTANGSVLSRTVDVSEPRSTSVEFWIEPLVKFRGRVIDRKDARPIAGATVEVWAGGVRTSEWSDVILASTRSDGGGTFELEVAPQAAEIAPRVQVRADGYCEAMLRVKPQDEIVVAMLPGATLEGIVVDERGDPIPEAGLIVNCGNPIDPASLGLELEQLAEVRLIPFAVKADVTGRFQRSGLLPLQEYTISLENPNVGINEELQNAKVKLGPAGSVTTTRIEKRAPAAPGTIEGVLRYNGKPAPLPFHYGRGSLKLEGKASAEGRYRIEQVPAGVGWITASIPGIASRSAEVTVPAGGVLTVDLDVRTAMSFIRGKVVTTNEEGIADLEIAVRAKQKDWGIGIKTNERGEFETMTAVAKDEPITLRIQRGSELITHEARGGDESIVVVLESLSKVLLRIVEADTRLPVHRFEIRMRRPGEAEWRGLGTKFVRHPDGVTEIAMAAGMIEIEVDRDLRFFSPRRVVAVASPAPEPLWVDLAPALTGVLRIEYVEENAEIEIEGGSLVVRPAGSEAPYEVLGTAATLRTGPTFREFSLPVGSFDVAFVKFGAKPVAAVTIAIAPGEAPRILRVRKVAR